MPEHVERFEQAASWLANARLMLASGGWAAVVMMAYTAAFQAAQAYVFDEDERTPKTHKGLASRLHQVGRLRGDLPAELVGRFATMHDDRNDAVYAPAPKATEAGARQALAWAEAFVAAVRQALEE